MDAKFAFILGAVTGSLIMKYIMKEKIKEEASKMAQEEIDDYIRGSEAQHKKDTIKTEKPVDKKTEKPVTTNPVPSFQKFFDDKKDDEYTEIDEDEFNDSDDSRKVSYTYYEKDSVVTDENNQRTDSFNNLNMPALFEDEDTDVIYVKNDELDLYFEIVRDYRSYADVVKNEPHLEGLNEKRINIRK